MVRCGIAALLLVATTMIARRRVDAVAGFHMTTLPMQVPASLMRLIKRRGEAYATQ